MVTAVLCQLVATRAPPARRLRLICWIDPLPFRRERAWHRSDTRLGNCLELLLHKAKEPVCIGTINDTMVE